MVASGRLELLTDSLLEAEEARGTDRLQFSDNLKLVILEELLQLVYISDVAKISLMDGGGNQCAEVLKLLELRYEPKDIVHLDLPGGLTPGPGEGGRCRSS